MKEHPDPVIRVLELVESEIPIPDVPPELPIALKFCLSKLLVRVRDSVRIGQTPAKTVKKKAHELRDGDVIEGGYTIAQVTVNYHTVDVCGTGPGLPIPI